MGVQVHPARGGGRRQDVQVVSMLRTTENKIYRQGISDPKELENGFPVQAEDLFEYHGIIMGSVEAGYFTPLQQELLREFVDRRGGGLLFLGGRFALGDGGWGGSSLVGFVADVSAQQQRTRFIAILRRRSSRRRVRIARSRG